MKLSIITATRNCAATVAECMTSILRQTHPDIEQIIIDGASTDNTLEVISRVMPYPAPLRLRSGQALTNHPFDFAQGRQPRTIRVVSEPDNGIYDAMNKGIALANGDVIGILNADDLYADETILKRVAEVFRDETVDSCYGDLVYVKDRETLNVNREKSKLAQSSLSSPFTLHHFSYLESRRICFTQVLLGMDAATPYLLCSPTGV